MTGFVVFDCLHFAQIRRQSESLYQDADRQCSVLSGTSTRRLSVIAYQPFSSWQMSPFKTCPHKSWLVELVKSLPMFASGTR